MAPCKVPNSHLRTHGKEEKNRDKWLPVRSQIHTKEHREKKILSKHRQASQIHTELMFLAHTELMFLAQQADSEGLHYIFRWGNTTESSCSNSNSS
jgi:hypothetical protein